ncbi:MAG: hypothetical protein KA105_06745 [Caulobacter sp.]|nr:hypothetical protein [Caulobacter sp.]
MTLRIDHDSIAKAMRQAALKAKYGTREEQAGRFIAAKPEAVSEQAARKAAQAKTRKA